MVGGEAKLLGEIMKWQSVAVEVIEGRNERCIFAAVQEIQHLLELIRNVEIIVLGEVDGLADALFEEDIDLLVE